MRLAVWSLAVVLLLESSVAADDAPKAEAVVSAAVTKALDYLAGELIADPTYEKDRSRAFYAPIIHAPLGGLALLAGGSTRVAGPHAAELRTVLAYVMKHGGVRKPQMDAINKAVRGNICSLTHNAGFSAMFLAQLLESESKQTKKPAATGLTEPLVSTAKIRKRLRLCCKTLEELQRENGGWQHGSGGANPLGYTHLMAATVTAMNGLAMAQQVGEKVRAATLARGLAYVRKATSGGHVGYAVGNKGSFSAGRNAAVLQLFTRLGLAKDKLMKPIRESLIQNLGKVGTGHGSPTWHLFYVGLALPTLGSKAVQAFDGLYRERLLRGQQEDGSIQAPGPKPGKKDEENKVWGALYTTPVIVLALLAPSQPDLLLYDFDRRVR